MPREAGAAGRAQRALAFALILAGLGAACLWLAGADQTSQSPAGWRLWSEVGPVRAIALSGEDVYAGGPMGLFRLTAGSAARVREKGTVIVNALAVTPDGSLWVGHRDGLLRFSGGQWRELTPANGLPGREVLAIAGARSGGIWVGTAGGAVKVAASPDRTPAVTEAIGPGQGPVSPRVSAIAEDDAGALWLGTSGAAGGGLSRRFGGQWHHWTAADGLPHADVVSLLSDAAGDTWVGCGRLDRGGAATLPCAGVAWKEGRPAPTTRLTGAKVRSLYEDSRGCIWLGTEYAGLTVLRGDGTIGPVTIREALPHPEVMAIAEASDGAVWLGTGAGLVRIARQAAEELVVPPLGGGDGG
jgi:ligand-binding sensor domain-containing protein